MTYPVRVKVKRFQEIVKKAYYDEALTRMLI
jgi:hypothetical protein